MTAVIENSDLGKRPVAVGPNGSGIYIATALAAAAASLLTDHPATRN